MTGAVIGAWTSGTTVAFQGPNGRDLDCSSAPPPAPDAGEPEPPTPSIAQVIPARFNVATGLIELKLVVQGTGFDKTSTVLYDGTRVPTAFVDSHSLRAILSTATLGAPGHHPLTVGTGTQLSAPSDFEVLGLAPTP